MCSRQDAGLYLPLLGQALPCSALLSHPRFAHPPPLDAAFAFMPELPKLAIFGFFKNFIDETAPA
jgi:hypothetical protein